MPLKVWNGSSWQMMPQMKVWNGSSWVSLNAVNNAKSAKVWNGSSWVQFHPGVRLDESTGASGVIELTSYDAQIDPSPASATVGINMLSNGTMEYVSSAGTQTYSWLLSGSNSDYYSYMDTPVGNSFTTGAVATSQQLNSTRAWALQVQQFGPGNASALLGSTLRIKNSAGTDILTISVSFSVDAIVF